MGRRAAVQYEALSEDGFLRELSSWTRAAAEELAARNDIGPLTAEHWKVIDYVRSYYRRLGRGPAVVRISEATGLSRERICDLFPCGIVRGAYRLAGLPRPPGCG